MTEAAEESAVRRGRFAAFFDRFEVERGPGKPALRSMEGLRGFAVTMVFFSHYVSLGEFLLRGVSGAHEVADALHDLGNTSVDLFFVLSGYLIYGMLLRRPESPGEYFKKRFRRIYPAFLVIFVIYLGLSFVFPAESKLPRGTGDAFWYVLANLALLPGVFPIRPMISVAWTLSYELVYYTVAPFLVALGGFRSRTPQQRLLILVLLGAALVVVFGIYGGPAQFLAFIAGMILFELVKTPLGPVPPDAVGVFALAAGPLSTLIHFPGRLGLVAGVLMRFFAFLTACLVCFRRPEGALSRFLSWRPFRLLGNASYSYYLIHGLALKVFMQGVRAALPPEAYGFPAFWAILPFAFASTLVAGAALFLTVEKPFSIRCGRRAPPRPHEGAKRRARFSPLRDRTRDPAASPRARARATGDAAPTPRRRAPGRRPHGRSESARAPRTP
jgi:peptidoglycan/LPS O-acetylase OafA/YrhL